MRKTETAIAINHATAAVHSAYGRAIAFSLTSDDLHAMIAETVSGMLYGKAPYHAKRFVEGYAKRMREELYKDSLDFRRIAPDGTIYSSRKGEPGCSDMDSLYGKPNVDGKPMFHAWPTGHYWRKTGKPFFVVSDADLAAEHVSALLAQSKES